MAANRQGKQARPHANELLNPDLARELLIEEYRTLRDESVQRITSRTQLVSVAVAAGALLVVQQRAPLWLMLLAAGFILGSAFYYVTSRADVRKIARHLVTVEQQLNTLARIDSSQAKGLPVCTEPMSWSTKVVGRRDALQRQGGITAQLKSFWQ
jgi:hypothetical protein